MKRVLYISNIEVPYRTEFFNQLSNAIDLTVLYERRKSSNRDEKWVSSVISKYKIKFLKGFKIKNEYCFDLRILKEVFSKKYDRVIIGCYNSPSQMLAIFFMKLFKKKYILNLDGEYFFDGKSLKKKIKRFFIKGAEQYLIAGEKSGKILSKYVKSEKVHPYYFSSLTKKEIVENSKKIKQNINDKVLVVGQYYDYKGLDISLEVAKLDQTIKYKFVGSGNRSRLLEDKVKKMGLKNVEIIPFLSKSELYKEYQECRCLLLTSRRECWGLVINEAASFGCPIVASCGSGAAVEMLNYDDLIKSPINAKEYLYAINNISEDKIRIIRKSQKYNIEKNVEIFVNVVEGYV